jgi:hypothetical protein
MHVAPMGGIAAEHKHIPEDVPLSNWIAALSAVSTSTDISLHHPKISTCSKSVEKVMRTAPFSEPSQNRASKSTLLKSFRLFTFLAVE